MFETLSKSLNPAAQKKDDEIKELRQRVEELENEPTISPERTGDHSHT
ncbi:MAG: hypothetical protein IPO36_01920 [Anaerolineales bacterium]|nr:hypothetical protein [Anaerolineales bacterium]